MVLSKDSQEFIANLRLYLMTSGKKDSEIKEIAEELRGHLEDAESRGKKLDTVTGGSPEAYIKNISNEMTTDFYGIIKQMPMFILLLIAYFITGSAVRGDLSFSLLKLIAFPLIGGAGICAYIYAARQMATKSWSKKKELTIFISIQLITVGLMSAVLFLDIFYFEPFYIPSREVMWIIAAIGVLIFIIGAIWSKTWITVIIPLFLISPDFIMTFLEVDEMTGLYINLGSMITLFLLLMLHLLIQNKKQNPHKV
ncbi:HAAS domain-containing protein [Metaplanococcus flavidus]|uniref:HAAS domain-containing protein n=1 Tax=Metaplanococcus flavidus TaxID=569883 RepID=A0ABW3LIG8_9BACL